MGITLEIHVQVFTDEIISEICFKVILRGCGDVVGAQISKPGDTLIVLKSAWGTRGHIMTLLLLCMSDTFHSKRILQSESKIKTLTYKRNSLSLKKDDC